MSSHPWDADRPLTLDGARAAIAAQFPRVDTRTLELLGSGWQFDAYLTVDGWVFRFPRQAWCGELFGPERRVHALVAPVLGPRITVPKVELFGEPGEEFPYPFAGHRFIAGVSADLIDSSLTHNLAREVGAALEAIHSITSEEAHNAGVLEPEPDEEGRRRWLARGLELVTKLHGLDPAVDEALKWMDELPDPLPRYQGPLRFVHNDLSPEHLVIDASTGSIEGILDWTEAGLGDVARDFVTLVTSRGWRFAEEVLRNYRVPLDRSFKARLRFIARLLSVIWLAEAHEQGGDVAKHVAWVVNAFSGDEAPL